MRVSRPRCNVHDQVGTYYAAGGRVITNLDGSRRDAMTPAGNLSTTKKGRTHIEEGTTDPPLRAVFVELLHDGPAGPLDTSASVPPLFPREGAAKPLDDERVTVWDYTWRAGSATTPVRYPRNALTVWLGAGAVRVTGADGKPASLAVEPGGTRYVESGTVERIEIVSGSPRAMVFEFR